MTTAFRLEPITEHNAMVFKAVRFCRVVESPGAFGSTYAKESQFSDAEWVRSAM